MQFKTILNKVAPQSSFVYGKIDLREIDGRESITVRIRPRKNSRPICSKCHQKRPGYDTLPERSFEFVPFWQIAVFFIYSMRRVNCPDCGIRVEEVPWAVGNCHLTIMYKWFLSAWAKRLSWIEVASIFHVSWSTVFRCVSAAVEWGLKHRDLSGIESIGVDEVQWQKGHEYLTLVYQIDKGMKRLLWIGVDRSQATLRRFFKELPEIVRNEIKYVCSDMWKPYLKVIAEELPKTVHILDRFHIMKAINKAIDKVRAEESRKLKSDGFEPILKNSRWCLLKRRENLTENQTVKLKELLKYNLKTVKSYLMKEDFQRFWKFKSTGWARRFLREWCDRTMRSKIEPMKQVAKMLRKHEELLLNWFKARGQISAGIVEGLNNKLKLRSRKSYGFRTFEVAEIALYHELGNLPTPEFTHKFW